MTRTLVVSRLELERWAGIFVHEVMAGRLLLPFPRRPEEKTEDEK